MNVMPATGDAVGRRAHDPGRRPRRARRRPSSDARRDAAGTLGRRRRGHGDRRPPRRRARRRDDPLVRGPVGRPRRRRRDAAAPRRRAGHHRRHDAHGPGRRADRRVRARAASGSPTRPTSSSTSPTSSSTPTSTSRPPAASSAREQRAVTSGAETRPGPHNDLTDVAGVHVGHYQRTRPRLADRHDGGAAARRARSAVSTSVAARPGTRETDALDPLNLVERVDAVCLTGGSAYGLAAADGVMRWLAERNRGFRVGPEPHHVVPIVPAAVLFDLGVGGRFHNTPDATFGRACGRGGTRPRRARARSAPAPAPTPSGSRAGSARRASCWPNGITVAALVALNSSGNVFDVRTGELLGLEPGLAGEFDHVRTPSRGDVAAHHADPPELRPLNTTLAVSPPTRRSPKHECARMAMSGQDGMARAIDPVHQYVDGDVVFALATGARGPVPERGAVVDAAVPHGPRRDRPLNAIFAAGADAVCRAIVHAAIAATSAGGMTQLPRPLPVGPPTLNSHKRARRHADVIALCVLSIENRPRAHTVRIGSRVEVVAWRSWTDSGARLRRVRRRREHEPTSSSPALGDVVHDDRLLPTRRPRRRRRDCCVAPSTSPTGFFALPDVDRFAIDNVQVAAVPRLHALRSRAHQRPCRPARPDRHRPRAAAAVTSAPTSRRGCASAARTCGRPATARACARR